MTDKEIIEQQRREIEKLRQEIDSLHRNGCTPTLVDP